MKDSSQKEGTKKGQNKKLEDYTPEELEKMDPEQEADIWAQAMVDSLNDPENHDKTT